MQIEKKVRVPLKNCLLSHLFSRCLVGADFFFVWLESEVESESTENNVSVWG